jgi:hypothetical protein
MDPLGGEDIKPIIKSRHDYTDGESKRPSLSQTFLPSDLVGCTFFMNEQEDGQHFWARIIRAIEDTEADLSTNPTHVQFICSLNDDEFEEILSYNEVLNHIESHDNNDLSFRTAPKYMYGYEVPRDYNHDIRLDQHNGSTKWQDSIKLEMNQLNEYETFKDHGHKDSAILPQGYKNILVHLVFAVKHDGCHKALLSSNVHTLNILFTDMSCRMVSPTWIHNL